jgi:hypothetical protein
LIFYQFSTDKQQHHLVRLVFLSHLATQNIIARTDFRSLPAYRSINLERLRIILAAAFFLDCMEYYITTCQGFKFFAHPFVN